MAARRSISRILGLPVLLVLSLGSCFDDPVGSSLGQSGAMLATVMSPNGAEGSAILELSRGTIDAIAGSDAGVEAFGVATSPARLVLLRRVPGDLSVRIVAHDVNDPPTLQVVEVAGPDNQLRPDLSGYSVVLTPAGN